MERPSSTIGWFVGLGVDDPVWDASVFSKNRDRLIVGEVTQRIWVVGCSGWPSSVVRR